MTQVWAVSFHEKTGAIFIHKQSIEFTNEASLCNESGLFRCQYMFVISVKYYFADLSNIGEIIQKHIFKYMGNKICGLSFQVNQIPLLDIGTKGCP